MSNNMRKLDLIEIKQVFGAETTLINREDGLHVYMTHKNEQFELGSLVLRPDGSSFDRTDSNTYHFEIIEKMWEGNGMFHARIWK